MTWRINISWYDRIWHAMTWHDISIFNQCIDESIFTDNFKFANITPALKANDPLDKNNCRPISFLSVLSKVLEGIMNDQLSDYFNHILSTLISAFRKHYSCQIILLKMIEDWKYALDKQKIIGAVTIDLSKAFDTIPHSLLVEKMVNYGLSNSAILMIRAIWRSDIKESRYVIPFARTVYRLDFYDTNANTDTDSFITKC